MKLSAGVLAALATVGDAAITCPVATKNLFEVECAASTGFKIRINEACRQAKFPMVDFANSFIYKANTPTAMANPSGTTYADVVNSETCVGGAAGTPKPTAGGSGNTDSDSTGAFSWDIPFACATASQTVTDNAGNKILQYDLFWNSQFSDANNVMYQLGQVQISCKVNPYQEDAVAVTVTEDAAVADISDKYVDVAGGLELKVNSFAFDGTTIDEGALTSNPIATSNAITYTANAGTAKIGDYMELEIAEVSGSGVLTAFDVSIEKCWASTSATPAVAPSTSADPYYPDSSNTAGAAGEFVFFDNFCPLYPSWVGPGAATGYLKETFAYATDNLHKVHFRQFGFQSAMTNYQDQNTGSAIYYHCFVKICDVASSDCSATLLDGTTATDCSSTGTLNAPPAAARRRRSADQEIRAEDITSTRVNVATVANCEERDDCFVYGPENGRTTETENNEEEQKTETEDDDSSALAATSAMAAVVLAVLN